MSQISYSVRKRHIYLPSSVMRPSALWFCTEVSSLSTDMRIIYRLFRVSLIGDLLSRFRCGCHGLHVDTGRFVNNPWDDRVCEVCKSGCVESEHHFLFDCPAYAHIRYSRAILFHGIQTVFSVINSNNPCLLGRYLRQCFQYRQSVLG